MENFYLYLALFLSIFLITTKMLLRQGKNSPPSPRSLPLICHLHLLKQPLPLTFQTLSQKYGPILSLRFGFQNFLILSSPSAVEDCFTKNDITFANRPITMAGDCYTYNYTTFSVAPYGQLWRSLRRVSTIEIFSQNSIQKFALIREGEVGSLVRNLYKISAKGPQKVELTYYIWLVVTNNMLKSSAGKPLVGDEIANTVAGKQRLKEIKETFFPSLTLLTVCDFLPFLRWVGYKGLEKNMKRVQRKRDKFLQGLIDEIRQKKICSKLNFRERTTFVGSLLQLQESDPEFYSDEVIKGIILLMFVAGTDTSASTLEWTMALLLNHPEAMQKLIEEIDNQVGRDRLLKDSDLPKLPYLRYVINEALRLYTAAPLLLPHVSSEDCTIGGYKIPRGTTLLVNALAIHRDPKVWDEPEKFKPERFKAITMNGDRDEGFKFIPFGVGRRVCPGAALAVRMVSLTVGTLVQCFEWERVGKELVDMTFDSEITLSKIKPLEAVCRSRLVMSDLLSQI
ncbi:hypothetical protein UlMin_035320 [Ulmus minor]